MSKRIISYVFAQIAQSVEQRTENPRVTGSIPVLGTNPYRHRGCGVCKGLFFCVLTFLRVHSLYKIEGGLLCLRKS